LVEDQRLWRGFRPRINLKLITKFTQALKGRISNVAGGKHSKLLIRHRRDNLSERERKSLDSRIEKLNFKCPVFNRSLLSNKLVEPVSIHSSKTLRVSIGSVIFARSLSIEFDPEADWFVALHSKHKM